MVGKFTETREIEQLRNHIMHGRIIYVFTGESFDLYYYNLSEESGVIKSYNIPQNMRLTSKDCSLLELISTIKKNLEDNEYHHLLYYGELGIDSSIYDFMKEFYHPDEELPLIVATAMVDEETIRTDISHPCNIQGRVLNFVKDFNERLMDEYVNELLFDGETGTYSLFSFWLHKNEDGFEVIFKSRYSEFINSDIVLKLSKQKIISELGSVAENLGIKLAI